MQRFGGATDAYGHTAAGAMSNAQNSFNVLREEIGKAFAPTLAKLFQWLATLAPKVGAAFKTAIHWISQAVAWTKRHKTTTTLLIATVTALLAGFLAYKTIVGVINAVEGAMAALNLVMDANPVILIIAAIVALGVAFVVLYKRSETFRAGIRNVFQWLRNAAQNVAHAVAAAFQWIANAATNTVKWIGAAFGTMVRIITWPTRMAIRITVGIFTTLRSAVRSVVTWIANAFKWLADKITFPFRMLIKAGKEAVGWAKGAVHDVGNFVQNISPFARGGLVPGFASGGQIGYGTDTVPAMLTPGEFVLRRQVVSSVGVQNLASLNQGGQLPTGQASHIEPGVTKVFIGARQVAEAVTHYSLKQKARR
jgi:phage-related protein